VNDEFFKMFGGEQQAAAPAAPAPAAPAAQAAPAGGEFAAMFGDGGGSSGGGIFESAAPGASPESAHPESPLTIADRARLGWVRTKDNQRKLLEQEFGKQHVTEAQIGDESAFVVRKGKEWYQVDPAMSWKSGKADIGGDIAQWAGEYGMRSASAAAAAGPGLSAGMEMGAPFGPYGVAIGGALGAMGMAGLTSSAAEGLDMASRETFNQGDIGGDVVPKSNEELKQQLAASFIFGAEQEVGGKALELGARGGAKALKYTIESMSDTPLGRTAAAKLLSVATGLKENLSRIRVEDPAGTAKYDMVAAKDVVNNTDTLGGAMKDRVRTFVENSKQRLRGVGKQYDEVELEASKHTYNPLAPNKEGVSPVSGFLSELDAGGFTSKGRIVDPSSSLSVERNIGPGERRSMAYLLQQAKNIAAKATGKEGGISYAETQRLIRSIDRDMRAKEEIIDPQLRGIIMRFRAGLKTNMLATLHAADPKAAAKLVALDSKYGPVKELMEHLAPLADDAHVDAFMKKVIKDDGSFNSELMSSASELLGSADPTQEILKMHVAKKSTPLLAGGHGSWALSKYIPRSPMGVSRAFTAASSMKSNIKAVGSGAAAIANEHVPYLTEAVKLVKTMDAATRKKFLANPQAVSLMFEMVGGAAAGERADKEELLRQGGAFE
jgi:hypothetical protein